MPAGVPELVTSENVPVSPVLLNSVRLPAT
jgi:hypothetical protein